MNRGLAYALLTVAVFFSLWPAESLAQPPKAGVVTTIHGTATVARAAIPEGHPLRFRDDLFLRDRISTKENSIVRALLGGKALVTIRELSVVTITEEVGRATVDMETGKIALAVARRRLRPGETLEIRTPNAIAAVRGTVVIVETLRPIAQPLVTNFHVLKGVIEIFLRGIPGATPLTVGAGLSLSITGNLLGQVRPSPPLAQVVQGLESPPQHTDSPAETKEAVSNAGLAQAAALANVLATPDGASSLTPAPAPDTDTTTTTTKTTEAPVISTTTTGTQPPQSSFTFSGTINLTKDDTLVTFGSDTTLSGTPAAVFLQNADVTQSGAGNLIQTGPGVNLTVNSPFLAADSSTTTTITSGGNLLQLSSSTLTSQGSLLDFKNTNLNLSGAVVEFLNRSTVANTAGPWIKISDGSLTADALVRTDESGNTFDLTGTLLELNNASLTLRIMIDEPTGLDLDNVAFSLAPNVPMFSLNSSTLSVTGTSNDDAIVMLEEIDLGSTFAGLAMIATNSTITNKGGGLLEMEGVLTTTTTNPLVQLTGSTVSTFTKPFVEVEAEPSAPTNITMNGPLMSVASTVTSERDFFFIDGGSTLTSNTSNPFMQFSNATVTVGSATVSDTHFFRADAGTVSLAGPLVNATDSNLSVSDFFLEVINGGQLTSTGTGALVQLNQSPLSPRVGTSLLQFLVLSDPGSQVNIAGTLLSAQNSDLAIPLGLMEIFDGGRLVVSGSTDPLVSLVGGTHVSGVSMIGLGGNTTATDPKTGLTLGTDKPLQHGGVLLQTSGATVSGQQFLRVDTALLEASAPLLSLNAGSNFTTSIDAVLLSFQAKVTSLGPMVKLDASTLNVNSRALLFVAGGSALTVTGNLLQLANGSTLSLLDGAVLRVTGGSIVDISGALVAFSGTGGNQINVTNTLCPCVDIGGIPVALTGGASSANVSITNPIKDSSLGSINLSSSGTALILVDGSSTTVTISGQ